MYYDGFFFGPPKLNYSCVSSEFSNVLFNLVLPKLILWITIIALTFVSIGHLIILNKRSNFIYLIQN